MRQLHNKTKLPDYKMQKLSAIGFEWNWRRSYVDALWETRYLNWRPLKRNLAIAMCGRPMRTTHPWGDG
jgi:hypothetical protein